MHICRFIKQIIIIMSPFDFFFLPLKYVGICLKEGSFRWDHALLAQMPSGKMTQGSLRIFADALGIHRSFGLVRLHWLCKHEAVLLFVARKTCGGLGSKSNAPGQDAAYGKECEFRPTCQRRQVVCCSHCRQHRSLSGVFLLKAIIGG